MKRQIKLNFKQRLSQKTKVILTSIISTFLVLCLAVFISTAIYGWEIYSYFKNPTTERNEDIYQYDKELGKSYIPNQRSDLCFTIGDPIPEQYDCFGFRVPINVKIDYKKRPLFLFLGCSFTYGFACAAENTFPYLVGEYFGGASINAGMSSCGFAEMLILAKRIIPKYNPDYVVVQYSPWLIDRSIQTYAPSFFGLSPHPYFGDFKGNIGIVNSPFVASKFKFSLSKYKNSKKNMMDFLSFLKNFFIPLQLYDKYFATITKIKQFFGVLPPPIKNKVIVQDYFLNSIYNLCEEYNSKMVLLPLIFNQPYSLDSNFSDKLKVSMVVGADSLLWKNLSKKNQVEYIRSYCHYRGDPPIYVDGHPNKEAHKIIAQAIIETVRKERGN